MAGLLPLPRGLSARAGLCPEEPVHPCQVLAQAQGPGVSRTPGLCTLVVLSLCGVWETGDEAGRDGDHDGRLRNAVSHRGWALA